MATKQFTKKEDAAENIVDSIYKAAGVSGSSVTVDGINGEITAISCETEWKEGDTKPVKNKKGEITGYKENFKNKSLTQAQIKKIDAYIADNHGLSATA